MFDVKELVFEKPDLNKFKCLELAYRAIEKGGCYPVILNAANEVLVDAFLNRKIKYTDIADGIEKLMGLFNPRELKTVDDILAFDLEVKELTRKNIKQ